MTCNRHKKWRLGLPDVLACLGLTDRDCTMFLPTCTWRGTLTPFFCLALLGIVSSALVTFRPCDRTPPRLSHPPFEAEVGRAPRRTSTTYSVVRPSSGHIRWMLAKRKPYNTPKCVGFDADCWSAVRRHHNTFRSRWTTTVWSAAQTRGGPQLRLVAPQTQLLGTELALSANTRPNTLSKNPLTTRVVSCKTTSL